MAYRKASDLRRQAKFLGANARRLYKVQAPANIIRERITEIERPDWWPDGRFSGLTRLPRGRASSRPSPRPGLGPSDH
jgi:hypothetical protein